MTYEIKKLWRVWVDKDGHINSHQPYISTSPVRWAIVREVSPKDEAREALQEHCPHREQYGEEVLSVHYTGRFCPDCGKGLR